MSPDLLLIVSCGIVLIAAAVILAIFIPNPSPFQLLVFRVLLALAAAGVGAGIPGVLGVNGSLFGLSISATGAIGLFILVYSVNPAKSFAAAPTAPESPILQIGRVPNREHAPLREDPELGDDGDAQRRRRALKGDDLKYYHYLSELKVNMLYDQLSGYDHSENKYQKLSVVLKHLKEQGAIGTIDAPGPYFAGVLSMRWQIIEDEVVFFLGHTEDRMIGLGGSPTHLLGRAKGSTIGSDAAVTQAALNRLLRQQEALRRAGEAIKPEDGEPDEAQVIQDWKTLLIHTSKSFMLPSAARPDELEFVAKTLVTQEGVLLGTPLYVAIP